MHISDLMDAKELERMVQEKYIRKVASPDGRHHLYNYSEKAAFERVWTRETRQCRGLITDTDGMVVCLPFEKFANLGEPGFPECSLEALVGRGNDYEVTVKQDGSMIAIWYDDGLGKWRCTTRGSFVSTQALAAQAWLDTHADYTDWPSPWSSFSDLRYTYTFLCEWVAPDNRVVLAHDTAELRLIGVRTWGGYNPAPRDLNYLGIVAWGREVGLAVTPRVAVSIDDLVSIQSTTTGMEGWVIRYEDGLRVKVKTADYIRLHKAISGFCPKQVYEAVLADLARPGALNAYFEGLPEEIREDAEAYHIRMLAWVAERLDRARSHYGDLAPTLQIGRREFAQAVLRVPNRDTQVLLFGLADGKDVRAIAWRQLRESLAALFIDVANVTEVQDAS